jgi:flagellar biosynthetic protein FliR
MNALYPSNWKTYLDVALIFLRLLGLFILIPGFSHKAIPPTVKLLFALSVTLVIYPLVKISLPAFPETWEGIVVAALRESAIGFVMGFVGYITFEGISLAAQFVGYQMGFGTVGLIDPHNEGNVSVLVPLHGWLAIMVFFMTDMHHILLSLFVASFKATSELAQITFTQPELLKVLVSISGNLFVLAIQMAAPFTLLMLCCNITVGILSRMMPQMNVMLFSFPITILLGFSALYVLAPDMLEYIHGVLGNISGDIWKTLKAL